MNDRQIKFSICIPVYNAERYIVDCIKSVICQTYKNWELVIIDDGSTDKSLSLCSEFEREDSRITVFSQENIGQIRTRLRALTKISGDYTIFLDSDDMLYKDALQILFNIIVDKDSDVVIFGMDVETKGGKICKWTEMDDTTHSSYDKKQIYLKILSDQKYNSICRKVFKTSILKMTSDNIQCYPKHGEDLLQSLYALRLCNIVSFFSDTLYFYRYNPSSVSHQNDYNDYKGYLITRKEVKSFLERENVFGDEEWKQYKRICLENCSDNVYGISRTSLSIKKRVELLKKYRNDEYVQWVISKNDYSISGYRKIIALIALKERMLYTTIFFTWILYLLKKIKR